MFPHIMNGPPGLTPEEILAKDHMSVDPGNEDYLLQRVREIDEELERLEKRSLWAKFKGMFYI